LIKRALRLAAITAGIALVSVTAQGLAAAAGAATGPAVTASPIRPPAAMSTTTSTSAAAWHVVASVPVATTPPPSVAAPPSTPAPVAAPAAATPTVAGQEATLVIASIGLRLPVVLGGQATIDRGLVTHVQVAGWRAPVPVGAAGTYWLAAHHVTHGAPFAVLPNIRVGAIVAIDPVGSGEIRYQVTSIQVVGTTASYLTVYGPDTTTSRILLQTCEGDANRILVHGVRIG
jgi:LPXTG-site transpeptidase (sortase) family protein